jgi:hypothetical protein
MSEACSRAKAAWDLVTAALNLREVAVADCMNDPYNIVVQWPYPIADPSAVATDEVQSLLESFASGANGAVTQLTVIQQCREKAGATAGRRSRRTASQCRTGVTAGRRSRCTTSQCRTGATAGRRSRRTASQCRCRRPASR